MTVGERITLAVGAAGLFGLAAIQERLEVGVKGACWASAAWCLLQVFLIQKYETSKGKSSGFSFWSKRTEFHRVRYESEIQTGARWTVDGILDIQKKIEIALREIGEADSPSSLIKKKAPYAEIEIKDGARHLAGGDAVKISYERFQLFESAERHMADSFVMGYYEDHYRFLNYQIRASHIDSHSGKATFVVTLTSTDMAEVSTPAETSKL